MGCVRSRGLGRCHEGGTARSGWGAGHGEGERTGFSVISFREKLGNGFTVDSPLQPFFFPDGAAHIKGDLDGLDISYHIADVRALSHDDLFTLAMWLDKVTDGPWSKNRTVLLMPYLPGARSDRGAPNGSRVYAEFLSNLDFDQIITLDPHSSFMPGLIHNSFWQNDNLTVFPVERIIAKEIQDRESDQRPQPYVGVIAPDRGAVPRAKQAAKVMGVPVYRAEKTRDFETGALTGFHMIDSLPDRGRLLIVDDICDGGGTFIGLADATDLEPERLDLWVTHGIFSQGVNRLLDRFGEVHTTDSYFNQDDELARAFGESLHLVKVHRVLPYLTSAITL